MTLPIFTMRAFAIYENPSDYPGRYVVRGATIAPGSITNDAEPTAVVDTLDAARAAIPADLVRLDRDPADDPVIVEVWV